MTEQVKEKAVSKKLSLTDISQLGYVKKTKEILEGVNVTLQTLSTTRQQKILSIIPADDSDALARYTQLQVETLAHATVAINEDAFTEADVDRLREFYGGLQSRVLQEVYAFYGELLEEQNTVLDSLKKS